MKKRMERNKRIKRNTKKNYICLYIYIYNACTDGKNFFHHGMPLAQLCVWHATTRMCF